MHSRPLCRFRIAGLLAVAGMVLCHSTVVFAEDSPDDTLILQAVAMRKNCREVYPALWEKINAEMFAEGTGFSQEIKQRIDAMEASEDPVVRGKIAGAAAIFKDPAILEAGCRSLAGLTP